MKQIRTDNSIIKAPLSAGYEFSSEFFDIFSKIKEYGPTPANPIILKATGFDTRLGSMMAIADEEGLYLLEFVDRRGLENEVNRLRKKLKATIIFGETKILKNIESEITHYFDGKNIIFKTPIHFLGSPFQKKVWEKLMQIPPGQTRSYLEIAKSIHAPTACRAVAKANSTNPLAIIVPCHRVINSNGELGGYSGGIARKQWLLMLEKNFYHFNDYI